MVSINLMVEVNRSLTKFHFSTHFWPPVCKHTISWCFINCTYFQHLWLCGCQWVQWYSRDPVTMEV